MPLLLNTGDPHPTTMALRSLGITHNIPKSANTAAHTSEKKYNELEYEKQIPILHEL